MAVEGSPESQKPPRQWLENEYELMPWRKNLEKVDLSDLEGLKFVIPHRNRDAGFIYYLRNAIAKKNYHDNDFSQIPETVYVESGPNIGVNIREKIRKQADAIERKIYKTRKLSVSQLRGDELFEIQNGVLYISKRWKAGRKFSPTYAIRLNPEAKIKESKKGDIIDVERQEVVEDTFRQWNRLLVPEKEAGERVIAAEQKGSVVNFIKALAGGASEPAALQNRKRIWNEMPDNAKQDEQGTLPEKLGGRGTIEEKRRQNRAMIKYLASLARNRNLAKLEDLLKVKVAPREEKQVARKPAPEEAMKKPVKLEKPSSLDREKLSPKQQTLEALAVAINLLKAEHINETALTESVQTARNLYREKKLSQDNDIKGARYALTEQLALARNSGKLPEPIASALTLLMSGEITPNTMRTELREANSSVVEAKVEINRSLGQSIETLTGEVERLERNIRSDPNATEHSVNLDKLIAKANGFVDTINTKLIGARATLIKAEAIQSDLDSSGKTLLQDFRNNIDSLIKAQSKVESIRNKLDIDIALELLAREKK